MPLVRAEVRNEYALGAPELYREANKEDPKEVLEGVVVSGLVGVLRQLGDLTEFAAEVFHGLQEELMTTSSRSHKLMGRVQRIEASLSPLERAVLAQRSHLHFAYTSGSNWHIHMQCQQNHFVYSDMPQFIMDSYEECHDPPCFHLLDRFDPGGPGSCLKRYSDPTFFKSASVSSDVVSTEKISKDKKGCRIEKRRSWPRNGEESQGVSFSYDTGRIRLTPLNMRGHPSLTQIASTLRSELDEQSNMDLTNGSVHTEGDSHPNYSVQPEELEPRESIFSLVKRQNSDFLDYKFVDEKITNAYDDLSQDQSASSLSSVTWDEKGETQEYTTQESDNDVMTQKDHSNRHLESFSPTGDIETLGDNAVDFETVHKMYVQSCDHAGALESTDVHLDDIESESDHFMDALNAIESEGETDVDCRKKERKELNSKFEDKGVHDVAHKLLRHNLECQSSSTESNALANNSPTSGSCGHLISMAPKSLSGTNCSLKGVAVKGECNSVSLVVKALQSSQRTGDSLAPGSLESVVSSGNGSEDVGSNIESVSCTISSDLRDSGLGIPITDGTWSSLQSLKNASDTSSGTSVAFWTNGGLLGLQPSKPPDCSASNNNPQDPACKRDGKISLSDQIENFKQIEEVLDLGSSACHEYHETGIPFRNTAWKSSPTDLDVKLENLGYLLHQKIGSTGSSVSASGSSLPVNSALQAARKHDKNNGSLSRKFELSNRLLATGSTKKLLPGGDENSYTVDYQTSNGFEQNNRQTIVYRTFSGQSKDLLCGESPILSPPSSPPLEHMEISFQPTHGLETSKLKLNFPNGSTNNGSGSEIFPSFQLVPEVSITHCNVGSDSDADSFYRSSPSLSDDCCSNQSQSNSKQWELSESLNSKGHKLYDVLHRIPLTESVSTVPENGRTNHEDIHESCRLRFPFVENGLQNSESCQLSDLQCLGSINHSFEKEPRNVTNPKDLVEPQIEPSPAPPPLPPFQWRGVTPHLDGMEDKCSAMLKGSCSASTYSQPEPAPSTEDHSDTKNMQKSKSCLQKTNRQREANLGKSIDEKDFLHQIRTKSSNLRSTLTTKPTVPSGAITNIQVAAMLKKVNAIRQAVGSEEDDENWSDT